MITFFTATLGCKINQYETRSIAEAWACAEGNRQTVEVGTASEADLILVNSCAVTAHAVADLRQCVRRLHRENPEADIIITGCAAQVMPQELAELPGVTRVVAQADKATLLGGPAATAQAIGEQTPFAPFSINGYGRARAVVKVQDGCSHHCTYCIVPLTRGKSVSRPMDSVVKEIARLLDAGFREFIISGINLRHFGRDLPEKPDFWDLMARLEATFSGEWAGRARLRISSVEPGQLTDKAFDTLAASSMICPQFHLSLQSGDQNVLRAMGRGHYQPETCLTFLERLKEVWPVIGLGADLITGFPGETDAQFEHTMDFCRELPLTYGHVFPYSERPGTQAAAMAASVDVPVRKERAARLRGLVNAKKRQFHKDLLDAPFLDVLMQNDPQYGVSQYYAPCRFSTVPAGFGPRALVRARPVSLEKGMLLVEAVEVIS